MKKPEIPMLSDEEFVERLANDAGKLRDMGFGARETREMLLQTDYVTAWSMRKIGTGEKIIKEHCTAVPNVRTDASIETFTDADITQSLKAIKDRSMNRGNPLFDYKGREIYFIQLPIGQIEVTLPTDGKGLCYSRLFDIPEKFGVPQIKDVSTIEDFCEKYLSLQEVTYERLSLARTCRGEKAPKPAELKGINQSGSIEYIPKKCTCQYYIKDSDVYIKHNDYFSPQKCDPGDEGLPLIARIKKYNIQSKKSKKFVYDDNWGVILQRQIAWIKISNIIPLLKIYRAEAVASLINDKLCEYERIIDTDLGILWKTFFVELCKQVGGKHNG